MGRFHLLGEDRRIAGTAGWKAGPRRMLCHPGDTNDERRGLYLRCLSSLVTVEFFPSTAKGTALTYTEQGAYFGGPEDVACRGKMAHAKLLEKLGEALAE